MTRLCLALILAGLPLAAAPAQGAPRVRPAAWAQPVIQTDLDNCHRVDERLYRSAQPDANEFREAAALGITTVLNLRDNHTDDEEAEGTGLTLLRVQTEADDIDALQIEMALRLILEAEGPVLVHCWHGSDRTGVVVAAYRCAVQGWTKEEALDEMLHGGFGLNDWAYGDHLREVIEALDVDGMRERLGVSDD